MLITSHAVCAPIVDVREDGVIRIARMTYTDSEGRISIRHIMESGKNGQSVPQTLYDALFDEARGDKIFPVKILSSEPILTEFIDEEYHYGGTHLKVAFPAYVPEQYLRAVEAVDKDDPDETHGPIKMVAIEDWMREARGTVPFHIRVTRAVLVWAATNPRVCERYYGTIRYLRGFEELTDDQKNAIATYTKKW